LKVEFKNVNQGDSIVITWNFEGKNKVGLVDCNDENGNPTLTFIENQGFLMVLLSYDSDWGVNMVSGCGL